MYNLINSKKGVSMNNFRYVNPSVIPACEPHKDLDFSNAKNGCIWNDFKENKPLFSWWITDFDCSDNTNWWYLIKEKPFCKEELHDSTNRNIRKALNRCTVKLIDPLNFKDELYDCYCDALKRYGGYKETVNKSVFIENLEKDCENNLEYWGAFSNQDGKLIGYMSVIIYKESVEFDVAKFSSAYMNLRPSDAIYATVLDNYLNVRGFKYVSSGSRSINPFTNTQDYKERTFGYRKAYCKLHLIFNPKYHLLIKCLYPFRKILIHLDFIPCFHRYNKALRIKEISREKPVIIEV